MSVRTVIAALRAAVAGKLVRGVVRQSYDDEDAQLLQVSGIRGWLSDRLEHFLPYGLTSRPLDGAETVVGTVGLSRDHEVVIAVSDRRYRLRGLAKGEVALSTDEGDSIVFRRGRRVEVQTELLDCRRPDDNPFSGSGRLQLGIGGLTVTGATAGMLCDQLCQMVVGDAEVSVSSGQVELRVGTQRILITSAGIQVEATVVDVDQA